MKRLSLFLAFFFLMFSGKAFGLNPGNDILLFKPAADGGRYLSTYQSQTLYRLGYSFGLTADYGFEPVEVVTVTTGTRIRGVVDDLGVANIYGAFGLSDWWQIGVNAPVVGYQTFYDPNSLLVSVQKETFKGKPGDPRIEMKFRLIDMERNYFGLAVIPFLELPIGDSRTYRGSEQYTAGGILAADIRASRRLYLALNVGYQTYKRRAYDGGTANAVINDTLILRGGANIALSDSFSVLGELYGESVVESAFKNQIQNPYEFLAGIRFSPQSFAKGLSITAAGGKGITNGFGVPNWRGLVQVNWRHSELTSLPPPPPTVTLEVTQYEEKITISQKIHFEFNRAAIRSVSYPILDDVVALLQRHPRITKIQIEGHTDGIGSQKYNLKLSQSRAESVKNYLIEKGILPDRLTAVGFGKEYPIADNETVEGRAKNRRTEFIILESTDSRPDETNATSPDTQGTP